MKIALRPKYTSIWCSLFFIFIFAFTAKSQLFNFRNYSLEDGLSQSEINCIYEDTRGYLWIGTAGGGLCRFDGKEFKTYEEKDGLCGQIITAIAEDASHSIIIGNHNSDLCKFDGQSFSPIIVKKEKSYTSGNIKFIITDDNKKSFRKNICNGF